MHLREYPQGLIQNHRIAGTIFISHAQSHKLLTQQQPNFIPLSGVGSHKLLRSLKIIEWCGHTTSSQQQLQGKDLEREKKPS